MEAFLVLRTGAASYTGPPVGTMLVWKRIVYMRKSFMNLSGGMAAGILLILWPAAPSVGQNSPSPMISFKAVANSAWSNLVEILEPNPNTQGAVGPHHVVTVLCRDFLVQDRTGGVVQWKSPLNFWTNRTGWSFNLLGAPYDQKVMFDPYGERWIVTGGANSYDATNAWILVAVSADSAPTGSWYYFRVPADTNKTVWADFPVAGFNKKWIAVHGYMKTDLGQYTRGQLYLFNKTNLYANSTGQVTVVELGTNDFSVIPATTWDADEEDLYMVHLNLSYYRIFPRVGRISGAADTPQVQLGVATALVNDAWERIALPVNTQLAPQLGTTNNIWINHAQLYDCLYRDGHLWFSHTIFLPTGAISRSAVQWWEVTTNAVVVQRGRVDDTNGAVCYAMPSLAVNKHGDMLLGYSSFSTSRYAEADYSFRFATDPSNTLRAMVTLKAGESPYFRVDPEGRNRWGSTSSTVIDPANDVSMWTLQEYAYTNLSAGTNGWGTWWGEITPVELSVTQTVSEAEIEVNRELTYTVNVTNRGSLAASDVGVADRLPEDATFVTASTTSGTWSHATGTVSFTIGDLAPGAAAALTVSCKPQAPRIATNTVLLTGCEDGVLVVDIVSRWTSCVYTPGLWINELHYDDTSLLNDEDEGVEIAGPAGSDLADVSLYFYNGEDGEYYSFTNLSGEIDSETNGFGAVWIPVEWLQNGVEQGTTYRADGVALVGGCRGVFQFLSYEGSFVASNGPANGLLSTDIGVAETNTTPLGYSLQLTGSGFPYMVFAWQPPATNSRGRLNAGQFIPPDVDGDGIPNDWENRYFGSVTDGVAQADNDTDTVCNVDEYIADTDPADAASRFVIDSIAFQGTNEVGVTFPTSTQRLYRVQYSTNLMSDWIDLQTDIAGTGSCCTVTDTNDRPSRAYRGGVRVP